MKKLYTILFFVFFTTVLFAQSNKNQKIKQVGDLYEVTVFYDNGKVMQHGFLSKDKKLHASWESFYEDGKRKCVATYDHGIKVGTWFYYDENGKKIKVIYDDNKIVNVKDLDSLKRNKN